MKSSIKIKLIAMSLSLVIITACIISWTVYTEAKTHLKKDSVKQLETGMDIIFDDIHSRYKSYSANFSRFANGSRSITGFLKLKDKIPDSLSTLSFITINLTKVTNELRDFAQLIDAQTLYLYDKDKRLTAVYKNNQDMEIIVGAHGVTQDGKDTFVDLNDQAKLTRMLVDNEPIPYVPLPKEFPSYYKGKEIDGKFTQLFSEKGKLGFETIVAIVSNNKKIGYLSGQVLFTKEMAQRYASLSKTKVNIFAKNKLSVGTFLEQNSLDIKTLDLPTYKQFKSNTAKSIVSLNFKNHEYYQAQCLLKDGNRVKGAVTVSISQKAEARAIKTIMLAILFVTVVVIIVFSSLIIFLFVTTVFQPIVKLTNASMELARGNLEYPIDIGRNDEMGALARAFNLMRDAIKQKIKVLNTEIKERKLVEDELLISEEKYRILIENANDAIFVSQDGVIKFSNKKTQELTGYSVEEMRKVPFVECIHPDDKKIVLEKHKRRLGGEKFVNSYSFKIVQKTGLILTVQLNTALVQWENKPATLNFLRDITQQKEIESQLQQSQKMESIGTLSGGIAHDFNNILFPIIGHTEMLLEDVDEDSPFTKSLNEIYKGALRAKDLVKQILTFSRQEKSELKLIKIQNITKEALKLIRASIPTTIDIKQDLQTDCGPVKADPTQIHQVIMNLATNAYHSMNDTGGILKVSLKQVEIEEHHFITHDMKPGIYALLTISDQGLGMDDSIMGKIFDPFFTTKEKGKGTGMGLSVVHGIVKSMNGAIQVDSEPNFGSEFKVYLPVEKSYFVEKKNQMEVAVQGGTEKILLVDDEESILVMEKRLLERLGYQPTSCIRSAEALEVFRSNPGEFDLVITDMAMPGLSGDELASELIKIQPDIPILLCTGFSDGLSEKKITSLGIKGFLTKPIMMKDLALKIREVLDCL